MRFASHHIAVNEHIIYVPTQFRNVKIGQKAKLGRKPKAKKGDALKKLDTVVLSFSFPLALV